MAKQFRSEGFRCIFGWYAIWFISSELACGLPNWTFLPILYRNGKWTQCAFLRFVQRNHLYRPGFICVYSPIIPKIHLSITEMKIFTDQCWKIRQHQGNPNLYLNNTQKKIVETQTEKHIENYVCAVVLISKIGRKHANTMRKKNRKPFI